MRKKTVKVAGVGINDAEFPISVVDESGARKTIKSYSVWKDMLVRCYSGKAQKKNKTYVGCTVCSEWLKFSNFHEWYSGQENGPGWQIDKDIINPGAKEYSPDNCVLVPQKLNLFLNDNAAQRGRYKIGVMRFESGRWAARCCNPFSGSQEVFGFFESEDEAHAAWREKKREHAIRYAESLPYGRLRSALCRRYCASRARAIITRPEKLDEIA